MDENEATAVDAPAPGVEGFRTLADRHRADIQAIRERNRRKRLRYVFYLNVLVLAYLMRRAFEGNPLDFGLPELGADAWIWLFPVLILLMMASFMLLPLANGRSPHIRYSPDQIGMTFADVRGIDVVLEEVTRTLQIFLTYKTFRDELGGNPRRGILFEGKPGTGKTHLAKAMAAEAGVPFLFVSAPAFQSMWFGMTAFKIRSFFKALRKAARKEGGAIGFIEEIDAVGSARGGVHASSRLGENTSVVERFVDSGSSGMVNELLIQLQSFDSPPFWRRVRNWFIDLVNLFLPATAQIRKRPADYSNVLIIGATNRADNLDPALMRPGRFDRILYFDLPGRAGRRDLIDYFLQRRSHGSDMDREDLREELAAMTLGYSPAMLEHILDEALVWAIRDGRGGLNWRDVQRARLTEEIGLGQPTTYTEQEKKLIATHEAGHAVAAYLCGRDRKLEVLSIIKRRGSLGLLAHSDLEERFTNTRSELEARLQIMLAGMAAEELYFSESGTGPASDLLAATDLAAQMIGAFGMGPSLISFNAAHGNHDVNVVAKVMSDDEGRKAVDDSLRRHKDEAFHLLHENRDLVDALRDALLEREELLGDEILAVLEEAERARA
ncbi:MAG TPA: AAA family ATPase [Actinomycetota bacterium]|nr:AAA family ATPase [Actinomycetota bacterium]